MPLFVLLIGISIAKMLVTKTEAKDAKTEAKVS